MTHTSMLNWLVPEHVSTRQFWTQDAQRRVLRLLIRVLKLSYSSPSLHESSSSSLISSSLFAEPSAGLFLKFLTASLVVFPKLSAFDFRRSLHIGQALMSGRSHSRYKECQQPRKMRHN